MIQINIAKDYTRTPGARNISDCKYSGEEFREQFLDDHFKDPKDNTKIRVIFDGAEGYATSFLEEAFGGLARKYGTKRCLDRFEFISEEEPLLIEEVINYIKDSEGK